MKKLILIFCSLSLGAAAQYSPKYDTVRLKRGGSIYRLIIRNDTMFINQDTILLAGITPPNYWKREDSKLSPTSSADTVGGDWLAFNNMILFDLSANNSNTVLVTSGDTIFEKLMPNITVQELSGTTPTWNVLSGINAVDTIADNTTITLSNLVAGTSGNLRVKNPATVKTLTFAGYTNIIAPSVFVSANQVQLSGGSKIDCFSWYYDGYVLFWNGTNDYN